MPAQNHATEVDACELQMSVSNYGCREKNLSCDEIPTTVVIISPAAKKTNDFPSEWDQSNNWLLNNCFIVLVSYCIPREGRNLRIQAPSFYSFIVNAFQEVNYNPTEQGQLGIVV